MEISYFVHFKVKFVHFELKHVHCKHFKWKCAHFTEINFWALASSLNKVHNALLGREVPGIMCSLCSFYTFVLFCWRKYLHFEIRESHAFLVSHNFLRCLLILILIFILQLKMVTNTLPTLYFITPGISLICAPNVHLKLVQWLTWDNVENQGRWVTFYCPQMGHNIQPNLKRYCQLQSYLIAQTVVCFMLLYVFGGRTLRAAYVNNELYRCICCEQMYGLAITVRGSMEHLGP